MTFSIDIHHIFTREALGSFGEDISQLFQPGEFNPFAVDNNINKIGLVQDPALAAAL